MDKTELPEYLLELQSALQELNDELVRSSSALRDPQLENDLFLSIGSKLDESITSINTLISDIENGQYDDPDDDTFQEE